MSRKRENTMGVLALLVVALCWGLVASTVKRLTTELDAHTISFFRVSLATIVFIVLYVLRRGDWRRIPWFWPWVFVGALGRAANYVLYNAGLARLPSSAATITAPVQTIGVILLALWIVGESVHSRWLGLALSLGGLLFVWWNGHGWDALLDPRYVWGNLLLMLAGLASAVQFTSQKVLSPKLSSLEILIPVFGWSALIHLPFAWAGGGLSRGYDLATWGRILFLGIVLTGTSYFFLAEGYRRCAATTAVTITNTSIFFTLLWSYALLEEQVSAIMVLGSLFVVAGAMAVVRSDRRAIDGQAHVA